MNPVKITELRPGLRITQISNRRTGVIIPPPGGESVELGRTWADLGNGPEQIRDDDIDVVSRHIRLTICHNPQDPAEDLKLAARVRRDLWAHSPVEIDPDNPSCQTRRDINRNTYFDFATEFPDEVRRILRDYGHEGRALMTDLGEVGLVCAKCGFISGFVTVCPSCRFRDIAPCPHCDYEIPRQHYIPLTGDLFACPNCNERVRLQFNPNLCDADGSFNEPAIIVHEAQG
jgi:hypothetical protein